MVCAAAGPHRGAMSNDFRLAPVRVWSSVLASLVPWLAFLVAVTVSDEAISVSRTVAVAPLYLGFVALPAFAAIIAGRWWVTRLVVTVVVTAVAAGAGVAMARSDDAQAGLLVLWVPMAAVPLAAGVWVVGAMRRRGDRPAGPARASDRAAAVLLDVVVLAAILVAPLRALDGAAAVVVGLVLPAAYLAAFVALAGRTPGQVLTGLTVVDHATGELVPPGRALLRSVVVVAELWAAMSVLAPLVIAELVAAARSGRSLTDRLFGTSVLATG